MPLNWKGAEIAKRATAASMLAVDATMAACVAEAKRNHDFANRTGTLEGSVRIAKMAEPLGPVVEGQWGSADVAYALYVEIGTSRAGPTAQERVNAAHGGPIAPPSDPLMESRPFLRPAADLQYPLLRSRVHAAFERRPMP